MCLRRHPKVHSLSEILSLSANQPARAVYRLKSQNVVTHTSLLIRE
jgi:hypothetical protein